MTNKNRSATETYCPPPQLAGARRASFPRRYSPKNFLKASQETRARQDAVISTAVRTASRRRGEETVWNTFMQCCGFDVELRAIESLLKGLQQENFLTEVRELQALARTNGLTVSTGPPDPAADFTILTSLELAHALMDHIYADAARVDTTFALATRGRESLTPEETRLHPAEMGPRHEVNFRQFGMLYTEFDFDEEHFARPFLPELRYAVQHSEPDTAREMLRQLQQEYFREAHPNDRHSIGRLAELNSLTNFTPTLNRRGPGTGTSPAPQLQLAI